MILDYFTFFGRHQIWGDILKQKHLTLAALSLIKYLTAYPSWQT